MEQATLDEPPPLCAADFYGNYFGHKPDALGALHAHLRRHDNAVVWLVGDSSLDNKAWLGNALTKSAALRARVSDGSSSGSAVAQDVVPLPAAYSDAFAAPRLGLADVAHWTTHELAERSAHLRTRRAAALNCAVEESTLRERSQDPAVCLPVGMDFNEYQERLPEHDAFVRDHVERRDGIVVSLGGNDLVLKPAALTAASAFVAARVLPTWALETVAGALVLRPLVAFFRDRLADYVWRLTARTRPRLVLLCMCYYPCMHSALPAGATSWADPALRLLGYDACPRHAQRIIDIVYRRAVREVRVPGVRIVPLALSEVLDGADARDYVARVEPSSEGGRRMARRFVDELVRAEF